MNNSKENEDLKDEIIKEDTVKTEDIKQSKPKKEKKHSNAKAGLIVIGGFVILCVIVMIATGAWNPFKNYSTDEKAEKAMEQSTEEIEVLADSVFKKNNSLMSGNNGFDVDFNPGDGCLKKMITADYTWQENYDLNFEIYYMKNVDYAVEKYNALKGGIKPTGYDKGHEFKNGKVYIVNRMKTFFYTIQDGSIVYNVWGPTDDLNKHQQFFDEFKIDFKLPIKDMQSK